MTTADTPAPPHPPAGAVAIPLWSAALPAAVPGSLAADPFGGCVVSTPTTLSAYGHNGRRIWDSPVGARTTEPPLFATDGVLLRIEGDLIVARRTGTGTVVGRLTAPGGHHLTLTPWADLLYTEHHSPRTPSVHCISRTGRHRWSRFLDPGRTPRRPFPLADLVVLPRRGALWAVQQDGSARWVADPAGVHPPHPAHDAPRPALGPAAGATIDAPPHHLDPVRALVSLRWHGGHGLFLLDAATPQISPVAAATPLHAPYAALPAPTGGCRVVAMTGPAGTGWSQPPSIAAVDPGGHPAWERPLSTTAHTLVPGGTDRLLLATGSPGAARVDCLSAAGTIRWSWEAPGPLTHLPVAAHGTVYAGSNGALWALAVRPAADR